MPGSRLLQSEGTLQAGRVTTSVHLRPPVVPETITIPPFNDGDFETIISTGYITGDGNPIGPLHLVDGQIFHLDTGEYRGGFVHRYGDAFCVDYGEETDTNISRVLTVENRPPGYITGLTTRWHQRGQNHVQLDNNVIIYHHCAVRQNTWDIDFDSFVALRVDPDTLTARYEYPKRPLGAVGTGISISVDSPDSRMVALDGANFVVSGTAGQAGGYQPSMWMIEYDDATGDMTGYGPFLFGDKAAAGDNESSGGEAFVVKLTGNRLLAVWAGAWQFDNGDIAYLKHIRALHAQVLDYDTTNHTVTATGPVRTFRSGVQCDGETGFAWYPDAELLVMTGLNYTYTNNRLDNSVDFLGYPAGTNHHIAARSLKVAGYDITERTTSLPIAYADNTLSNFDSYWYVHSLHGAGDRLMVVWPHVDDTGGDLMYTKFKVGTSGAGMGSLAVYDEGILIPDPGGNFETWPHCVGTGYQTALNATENLSVFEHYIEDYARWVFRFVLCREP